MTFAAQISGFVALLATAMTFVIRSLPEVRQVIAWHDNLKVLSLKSNEYIVVANDGDGPLYLSHASLLMDLSPAGIKTRVQRFNVLVPQDTIQSIPITPEFQGHATYVGNVSQDVWKIALQEALPAEGDCFWPLVFTQEEPSFLQVKEAYASRSASIRTFPARATVAYYSLHTKKLHELELPAIGAITFRDTVECTAAP